MIQFQKNLEDRFGKIPVEGEELLSTLRLKWLASKMGLERLIIKNKKFVGYFCPISKVISTKVQFLIKYYLVFKKTLKIQYKRKANQKWFKTFDSFR